jgi:DNA-binding GntR family transcriptional regulator
MALSPLEIATDLRRDILSGRMIPGSDLPQEELAQRFGVSRVPVRDALNLLAAEKLVCIRPNRGARVIRFTRAELEEAFSLRIMLECDCLRRAVPSIDDQAVKRIAQAARRCEVEADQEDFHEHDWNFHRALYEPANRPMQLALIGELRRACQVHVAAYDRLRQERKRFSTDHAAILAACRKGNSDAAVSQLRAHLERAARALNTILKRVAERPARA